MNLSELTAKKIYMQTRGKERWDGWKKEPGRDTGAGREKRRENREEMREEGKERERNRLQIYACMPQKQNQSVHCVHLQTKH